MPVCYTDGVDRRTFLAWFAALGAAGCTQPEGEAATAGSGPSTSAPSSAGPATTIQAVPSTTVGAPPDSVTPLEAPASGLPPTTFALGVASGDPTATSVVLWAHLDGLANDEALVWEVAADDDFADLLATDVVTAAPGGADTVRVVADGLPGNRVLWYRFRAGDTVSPIGRTRTLPAPGDAVDRFRIAVSSCQLMETGHWAAHHDIAAADVDLVVWLGDYIYEGGGSSALTDRAHRGGTAESLEAYRDRYRQYRQDPALQAAHASAPWFVIWDDHEVVNDYDVTVDPRRRRDGYQAWQEFQPVDLPSPDASGLLGYRSIEIGTLAHLALVDVRQYAEPAGPLLGDAQWQWLEEAVTTSPAQWTIIGSPVLVSGLSAGGQEAALDYTWSGHPEDRRRLADLLARGDSVVVSGDLHAGMALEVHADDDDPESAVVAPEFMAPAVSSAFPADLASLAPLLPLVNPHLSHVDTTNGWLLLECSPQRLEAHYRTVDDVTDPASGVSVAARFEVLSGDPRLHNV